MNAMSIITKNPALVAGGVGVVVLLSWIAARGAKQTGSDLGRGMVDLATGTLYGTLDGLNGAIGLPKTGAVIDWANSSNNPLQPAGAWIGGTLYDLMHSKANGGIW